MSPDHDPSRDSLRKLNLRHFCRDEKSLTATVALAEMPRLRESLFSPEAHLSFTLNAQGSELKSREGRREEQLALSVSGTAPLQCQRCLAAVAIAVQSTARFVIVATESEADEIEAASQDEDGDESSPEPLVVTRPVDLITLAEDEILLSLPIVPMHEQCPAPLIAEDKLADEVASEEQEKPHPFAALAALKTKKIDS
jgi:uncharacterized protein